ncbi:MULTISPECIES: PTS lactose/cellobiose transporter subunit IIA [Cytobacillus]|uniref:PTS mannose transporter subunit IIA n=2 Tax=Cytobacillus TaxID=2675230 RepID=A0A0Q3SFQ2_9BACI|nr:MULTISPECIES: PTS lactose/cellobiose transporter subunit IIA [Cytobacillus]KOP70943.1 PTS mannose transporter subunit IIA [Bacillus sp. FJAT-21945]KQL18108.1 PTS mannose transporter subunit IIA [Cytobacillus solani]MED3551070.1 PTS lactose/cellobiose transporter subunit IIA [Cytobacillus praedii]TCJ04048.1 PTS lactose/cellobiose transporter subunit IIA [Cytobacillus praedii]USK55945.1 PTS lactose/cellobiose transporter subunit IIA [Cytobacillus solani]
MEESELMQAIMGLILHSGNTKSDCMEAIQLAKKGEIAAAKEKIELANQSLVEAHHSQTALLTQEARGEKVEVSMMLIHAQDHLMNSITFRDLAKEIIELYERLEKE